MHEQKMVTRRHDPLSLITVDEDQEWLKFDLEEAEILD